MLSAVTTNSAYSNFYMQRENLKNNLTFKEKTQKQNKPLMAGLSLMGAVAPVVLINIANGNAKKAMDGFRSATGVLKKTLSLGKMFKMEKYTDLLASTAGAVIGGIAGGILGDKDKKNKKEKFKEGTFEFLNNIIPTTIVALAETFSKKTGKLNSAPQKALTIAASVASGMFIANKASNKINEKVFDKDEKKPTKRKFKISDCLVHMDDILGILVLAKIPLAQTIHADKILPLLYAKTGYETAQAKKEKNDI